FSSRRRHTRSLRDWSSDVCSSDLVGYYRFYGLRDFTGALAEFQLAEKSLPNNVDVLKAIGLIQRRFAHWDEAITVLRRVVELDRSEERRVGKEGSHLWW